MTEVQPLPRGAEADTISEALWRSGLPRGMRVREVAVESARTTVLSRIVRFRLRYDGDAAGAPEFVILKTGLPERIGRGWKGGLQETTFYRDVAPATDPRLVLRCFDASYDTATGDWHLLLEDLTDTHIVATAWPLPPATEQCATIIDTLARFHAAWWDDARLGNAIGTWSDAAATDRMVRDLAERFAGFADRLGDSLPRERCELYERFLAAAPRLLERYHTHRDITVLHGDAHVWNVFIPRDGGSDMRLFDWDSWRLGVAAGDLAYMMALHWYPDRRRRLERMLLDRYHAMLLANGVRGYDRSSLYADYRRAVLWQIATPVWQASANIPPVIWWNHMERIMLAVDDLDCRELLS